MNAYQEIIADTRGSMLKALNNRIKELREKIANNKNEIVSLRNKAANYADHQDQVSAQHAMSEGARLQRQVLDGEHEMKNLELEAESIRTGNHHIIQSLAPAASAHDNAIKLAEHEEALSEFEALLTDDISKAAKRLVNASQALNLPTSVLANQLAIH